MPVMRYFMFVGAALLALLFVAGVAFPTLPAAPVTDAANTAADLPMIRIHSDRKWPERVIFDTSVPTLVPAQARIAKNEAGATAAAAVAPAQVAANSAVDSSTKATAQDAFAQLVPSDMKKASPKPQQKRKVAKRHVAPPTMLVAQRPQFGLFANNLW
jgi:hypothetical protein